MATYQVTTPVAGFSGAVGNVHFAEGAATVDDATHGAELNYFRAQGYGVEEIGQESGESAEDSAPVKKATKAAARSEEKPA